MKSYDESVMKRAIEAARECSNSGIGGPFGAAVVKDGVVISVSANSVISSADPTAHAEINAIRAAGSILGTHDLSGCELYATGYPCPMCLSAIMWANIKTVYYCNELGPAEAIGFRDTHIYEYITNGCNNEAELKLVHTPLSEGQELYDDYKRSNGKVY